MSGTRHVYLYKMVCDNGGAPCPQNRLLSLAICKPRIRGVAKKGDLLLGFVGKTMKRKDNHPPAGALIYAARVDDVLAATEYYDGRYAHKRDDAIYKWNGSRFEWIKNLFHEGDDDMAHDLGQSPEQSKVLLCRDYRYFGRSAKVWGSFPLVNECIGRLQQGHRVNHSESLAEQLLDLEREIWATPDSIDGQPIQKPDRIPVCGDDEGEHSERCKR